LINEAQKLANEAGEDINKSDTYRYLSHWLSTNKEYYDSIIAIKTTMGEIAAEDFISDI